MSRALTGALEGRGRLLLIGGESGVGKTRLVEEFRSLALVQGAYVIRGQAIDSGRRSYQLWRSAIKAFASLTQISPEKAGIIQQIVPDIEDVLQIRAGTPPILDPREARELLVSTIVELITNEGLPLVLILEDLQWMGNESLALLQSLVRAGNKHRILIVGTYRNDERPDLPEDLPASRVLELPRLEDQAIADLSRSILGAKGEMPEIVEFLNRQTEGNPFFIVEMLRALAEETGRLSEVGEKPIPEKILPGGVKQIIDRRIGRVPQHALPLLELAAIAGREIDFPLMVEISPDSNLDAWRLACSESGILAITGETWRFAHDKLREGLLARMKSHQSQEACRQVAESIEDLYPEVPDEAARLAHLWDQAGNETRHIKYSIEAGDYARFQYAFTDSIDHYLGASNLLIQQGQTEQAAEVQMKMAQVHENAFQFEEAREVFSGAFLLWRQTTRSQFTIELPTPPHPLRLCWSEPLMLDPLLANEITSMLPVGQLFEGLCELTQSFDLMPAVAESWEILDSGRRYRFHLPEGGRWSDGEPLTAFDFEYTFRRLLDPALKSFDENKFSEIVGVEQYRESEAQAPEQLGVRATGPLTVEIELEEAIGGYLYELASVMPVPKHVVELNPEHWATGEELVCNGPFRIGSWVPGVSMELVRNPYYSGRYRGNVENARIDFVSSGYYQECVKWFEDGGVDLAFITTLTGEVRERIRSRHGSDFKIADFSGTACVDFDCWSPPFDDPEIRRAFAMAVDKEKMADKFGWGGVCGHGGVIPPSIPGHTPILALPFDPEQALNLLSRSIHPKSLNEQVLVIRGYAQSEGELAFLKAQWSEHLRVEVRTETLVWHEFLESLDTDPPEMAYAASGGFPAENMLRSVLPSSRTGEDWTHPEFDQSLKAARKARDPLQRLQLIQEADRIVVEEAPVIPIIYPPMVYLAKPWPTSIPISHVGFWSIKDAVLEPH